MDALLLNLPGVSAGKINGLDAYLVSHKMFTCISGVVVGLRPLAATANELQFSRNSVVPYQPGGMASSREWIQINCVEVAEYEKDLQLFRASLEFVKKLGRNGQVGIPEWHKERLRPFNEGVLTLTAKEQVPGGPRQSPWKNGESSSVREELRRAELKLDDIPLWPSAQGRPVSGSGRNVHCF